MLSESSSSQSLIVVLSVSFSTTLKRKASPLPAASRLLVFAAAAAADAGVCATCGQPALTAVWPLPPGKCAWGCLLIRCAAFGSRKLKAFELRPYSHSPKDLNEGTVMTLRMGFIIREIWGSSLQGLRSLVAAVFWRNMGRAESS